MTIVAQKRRTTADSTVRSGLRRGAGGRRTASLAAWPARFIEAGAAGSRHPITHTNVGNDTNAESTIIRSIRVQAVAHRQAGLRPDAAFNVHDPACDQEIGPAAPRARSINPRQRSRSADLFVSYSFQSQPQARNLLILHDVRLGRGFRRVAIEHIFDRDRLRNSSSRHRNNTPDNS